MRETVEFPEPGSQLPNYYGSAPVRSADQPDDDRFAAAISRLQMAHENPAARITTATGDDHDLVELAPAHSPVPLPSRRDRRAALAAPPPTSPTKTLVTNPETTPRTALQFARLYAATAGHAPEEDPPTAPGSKPRFGLARTAALAAAGALLTIGCGVAAANLRLGPTPDPASAITTSQTGSAPMPLDSTPQPAGQSEADAESAQSAAPAPGQIEPEPQSIFVHVVGQVAKPGVVELTTGARVAEAIESAGGALSTADLAAINLARIVVDGEQLRVPAPGEAVTEPPPSAPIVMLPSTEPADTGTAQSSDAGKVNLNTADAATLQTLPGIGPALSERIIQWREINGPFASIDEITNVSGIGPAVLANVRDRVVV